MNHIIGHIPVLLLLATALAYAVKAKMKKMDDSVSARPTTPVTCE